MLEPHVFVSFADLTELACDALVVPTGQSTEALRDWLEAAVRQRAIVDGLELTRPVPPDDEAPEAISARDAEVQRLREALLQDIEGDSSDPTHPQHTRWILAYLIDWHRREERASWWEYLSLLDVVDQDDLLEEPKAIAGLTLVEQVEVVRHRRTGRPTGSVINRYGHPVQELDLGKKGELMWRDGSPFGTRFGELQSHDRIARTLDIKVAADAPHPDALFLKNVIQTKDQQAALKRLAEEPDAEACAMDLLHRHASQVEGRRDTDCGP